MYKIVIHLVPNPGFEIDYTRDKLKIKTKFKQTAHETIKTIRFNSFFAIGPKLYNSIPTALRELEDIHIPEKKHVETFKKKLDAYLTDIPDIPGTQANSLLNQ